MSSSFVRDCTDTAQIPTQSNKTVIIIVNNDAGNVALDGNGLQNILASHGAGASNVSVVQMGTGGTVAAESPLQNASQNLSLNNLMPAASIPLNFTVEGLPAIPIEGSVEGYTELPLDVDALQKLESVLETDAAREIFGEPLLELVGDSQHSGGQNPVISTSDSSQESEVGSTKKVRKASPKRRSQRQVDKAEREEVEKILAENQLMLRKEREALRLAAAAQENVADTEEPEPESLGLSRLELSPQASNSGPKGRGVGSTAVRGGLGAPRGRGGRKVAEQKSKEPSSPKARKATGVRGGRGKNKLKGVQMKELSVQLKKLNDEFLKEKNDSSETAASSGEPISAVHDVESNFEIPKDPSEGKKNQQQPTPGPNEMQDQPPADPSRHEDVTEKESKTSSLCKDPSTINKSVPNELESSQPNRLISCTNILTSNLKSKSDNEFSDKVNEHAICDSKPNDFPILMSTPNFSDERNLSRQKNDSLSEKDKKIIKKSAVTVKSDSKSDNSSKVDVKENRSEARGAVVSSAQDSASDEKQKENVFSLNHQTDDASQSHQSLKNVSAAKPKKLAKVPFESQLNEGNVFTNNPKSKFKLKNAEKPKSSKQSQPYPTISKSLMNYKIPLKRSNFPTKPSDTLKDTSKSVSSGPQPLLQHSTHKSTHKEHPPEYHLQSYKHKFNNVQSNSLQIHKTITSANPGHSQISLSTAPSVPLKPDMKFSTQTHSAIILSSSPSKPEGNIPVKTSGPSPSKPLDSKPLTPTVQTSNPLIQTPKSSVHSTTSLVQTPKSLVHASTSLIQNPKSSIHGSTSLVHTPNHLLPTPKQPLVHTPDHFVKAPKHLVQTPTKPLDHKIEKKPLLPTPPSSLLHRPSMPTNMNESFHSQSTDSASPTKEGPNTKHELYQFQYKNNSRDVVESNSSHVSSHSFSKASSANKNSISQECKSEMNNVLPNIVRVNKSIKENSVIRIKSSDSKSDLQRLKLKENPVSVPKATEASDKELAAQKVRKMSSSIRRSRRPPKKKTFGDDIMVLSDDGDDEGSQDESDTNTKSEPEEESHEAVPDEESEEAEDEEVEDDPDRLWCICNRPHNNRFMICCDRCEDWFHGSCVGISKSMGKQMEEHEQEWICPKCKKAEQVPPGSDQLESENVNGRLKEIVSPSNAKKSELKASLTDERKTKKHSKHQKEKTTKDKEKSVKTKDKTEPRVLVYEKATGIVLTGTSAPTLDILGDWLQENPEYTTLQPAMMNSIKHDPKSGMKRINLREFGIKPELPKKRSKSLPDGDYIFPQKSSHNKSKTKLLKPSEVQQLEADKKLSPQQFYKDRPSKAERKRSLDDDYVVKKAKDSSSTPLKKSSKSSEPVIDKVIVKPDLMRIRMNVRNVLYEALNKRKNDADKEFEAITSETLRSLCAEIEENLFNTFNKAVLTLHQNHVHTNADITNLTRRLMITKKCCQQHPSSADIGFKYKSKYRSLIFNIKDTKNGALFRNILNRSIPPNKLASMTSDEMASKELVEWREREEKKEIEAIEKHELELLALGNQYIMKSHKGEIAIDKDEFSASKNKDIESVISIGLETSKTERESSPKEDEEDVVKHRNHIYDPHCRLCSSVAAQIKEGEDGSKLHERESESEKTKRSRGDRRESESHSSHHSSKHKRDRERRHSHKSKRDRRDRSRSRERKRRSRSREKKHSSSSNRKHRSRSRDRSERSKEGKDKESSSSHSHRSSRDDESRSGKRRHSESRSDDRKRRDSDRSVSKRDVEIVEESDAVLQTPRQSEEGAGVVDNDDAPPICKSPEEETLKSPDEQSSASPPPVMETVSYSPPPLASPATPPLPEEPDDDSLLSPATPPLPDEEEDRLTPPPPSNAPKPPAQPPVWKGIVNMPDVAKFAAAGFEVSGKARYFTEDVPSIIEIVGRINPDNVWSYIAQMKKSGSKEILVIRFQPSSEEEKVSYIALYSYLSSKRRYGVIGNCEKSVKDFYIVPLASHQPIPQVLLPLDGPGFEESRPHMLIGVVIRTKHRRVYDPVAGSWISIGEPSQHEHKSREREKDRSYTPPMVAVDRGDEPIYSPGDLDEHEAFTPSPASAEGAAAVAPAEDTAKGKTERESMLAELNRQIERDKKELSEMQKEADEMEEKIEEIPGLGDPLEAVTAASLSKDEVTDTNPLDNINIPSNLHEILSNIKKKESQIKEKEDEIKRTLNMEPDYSLGQTTPANVASKDVDLRVMMGSSQDQDLRVLHGTGGAPDKDMRSRDPRRAASKPEMSIHRDAAGNPMDVDRRHIDYGYPANAPAVPDLNGLLPTPAQPGLLPSHPFPDHPEPFYGPPHVPPPHVPPPHVPPPSEMRQFDFPPHRPPFIPAHPPPLPEYMGPPGMRPPPPHDFPPFHPNQEMEGGFPHFREPRPPMHPAHRPQDHDRGERRHYRNDGNWDQSDFKRRRPNDGNPRGRDWPSQKPERERSWNRHRESRYKDERKYERRREEPREIDY